MDMVRHDHIGKRVRQTVSIKTTDHLHHHLRRSGVVEVVSTALGDGGQDVGLPDPGMAAKA